jgi:hypothetical protein
MIPPFPNASLALCALCLLLAVVMGAFRHWCTYLWRRTEILLVAAGGGNKPEDLACECDEGLGLVPLPPLQIEAD